MPKGPTKRRPQTRARLLDAAMEAFAELGFHGATIDEICRRAGYTTGAYYSNFASKDELFYALFDEQAAKAVDRLSERLSRLDDPTSPEQLVALAGEIGPDERQWFLVSTEFTLYAMRNPEAARTLADHDARVRAKLVRVLSRLLDEMGRSPSVDLEQFARLVIAVREGGLMQSLVEPEQLPPNTLERAFLPVLLRAASEEREGGPRGT
ncbi:MULTISPECIES: TetR/AcrR family transcriptional regulator [unclassified Streptomyces]|uniref:TetR/AcrR family transcriptional regulator n=1 Tax=unclassified Streptomyces TaxID=2593676 RepID=UPI0022B6A7A0|nr:MULTISPECIES: TetR/AcrR family transcriptional regulator [unclassified Streptomyces]MCZ7416601.1 TetR/AcrR family transcriptional regulator [Streptomyces sp. WMMC897]MCZ7433589.1 TetR/AcrR family transcriptional regulator [Streptomyces sp. WMMC1477]